jgi:hypothetical protein
MSEPRKHLSPIGVVADYFDDFIESNEKFFDDKANLNWHAALDSTAPVSERLTSGAAWALWKKAGDLHGHIGGFSEGFVDAIFRGGDSLVERNAAGIGKEFLRKLNIISLVELGPLVSELALITQEAGTMTCTFVSTVNAINRTGRGFLKGTQRLFIGLADLCKAAGVDVEFLKEVGTNFSPDNLPSFAPTIQNLIEGLNKLKIAFTQIPLPTTQALGVVEDIVKANPKGVLVIPFEFGKLTFAPSGELVGEFAHCVNAQLVEGAVVFMDTDGQILKGVTALAEKFPNPILSTGPILFFKNAKLLQASQSLLFNIFFPVVMGPGRENVSRWVSGFVGRPQTNATVSRRPSGARWSQ